MMYGLGSFLYVIFIVIAWVMTLYTVNFYYLAYQSQHNSNHEKRRRLRIETMSNNNSLPVVTVQLPLYNEKYVATRLIDAVCQLDYPKDKLEIQVLDDSDDDTVDIIRDTVSEYKFQGFDIHHIHRTNRTGYKAGALKAGTKDAKGEFIAIFDADFIPPPWFLKQAIVHFVDPKVGLVQCRWGHVNENYSSLTEAQAVSLDLHFLIEQKAKSLTHLFMNFNGTAGIWRKSCIIDAGGWHTGTLVEDLDLSYRAQLKGWKSLFLEDLVVNAELPVQMNAAKRQQFRWAKGSMQVALKLMVDVAVQRKLPVDTKVQAFIQLTRHIVNPLFLIQFLIFPILLGMHYKLYAVSWAPVTGIIIYVVMGPLSYLFVIRKIWGKKWKTKARQYLFLIFFASGISVNNTVAVFDAIFGKQNEFLRTPKFGIVKRSDEWRNKEYVLPFTKTTLLEIFFGIYGCIAIFVSIFSGNPIFVPVIAIQTAGFIYIAYMSIAHSSFKKKKSGVIIKQDYQKLLTDRRRLLFQTRDTAAVNTEPTDAQNTALSTRRRADGIDPRENIQVSPLAIHRRIFAAGIISFIILGAGMALYGYQTTIYPIDKAIGYLERAQSSQTPEEIASYVQQAKELLPKSGNPVWSFPTARTDFGLIQNELDNIQLRTMSMSGLGEHSFGYNTGMRDMHLSLDAIGNQIGIAMPFVYVSFTTIVLSTIWIVVIVFAISSMRNGRAEKQELEEQKQGEKEYQTF